MRAFAASGYWIKNQRSPAGGFNMPIRRFITCTGCSSPLAARCWSEATDGELRTVWHCLACDCEFETVEPSENSPTALKDAMDAFWPILLVA